MCFHFHTEKQAQTGFINGVAFGSSSWRVFTRAGILRNTHECGENAHAQFVLIVIRQP